MPQSISPPQRAQADYCQISVNRPQRDSQGLFDPTRFSCKYEEKLSALGRTRTCDLLIRSQTLYPAELRAHREGI